MQWSGSLLPCKAPGTHSKQAVNRIDEGLFPGLLEGGSFDPADSPVKSCCWEEEEEEEEEQEE
eukprot:7415210-Pyramimonas_sp.AAC.1